MNGENINIVVASDENYVPHLETLLVSIGENNKNVDTLMIYIFDNGITIQSKNSIEKVTQKYSNMQISYFEMGEKKILEFMESNNLERDRSLAAYARIFIPELIESDRALYFDVDGIVLNSLTELYNQNLSGYAIAGVQDTNPISRHYKVGLKDNDIYINSGMILWNLDYCRKIHFTSLCKSFIQEYKGKVDAMDQGTINGVLAKKQLIKLLSPQYNVFTSLYQLNSKMIKKIYGLPFYYSDTEIKYALVNPIFVHFTPNMTTRPWIEHCKHPLKDKYWNYRKMTDFYIRRLLPDNRSIKLKLLGWIYRNYPIMYNFITKLKFLEQKSESKYF